MGLLHFYSFVDGIFPPYTWCVTW